MRSMRTVIFALSALFAVRCNRSGDQVGSSGFIETDESIVAAETSGRIESRDFSLGSLIKVGDTLVHIDPSKLELQLTSLKASRQVTQATLGTARLQVERSRKAEVFAVSERDRVGRLLKSGSATQKQFDQLSYEADQATNARQAAEAGVITTQAQLEKIDADVAMLERQIQDCTPLSPVAGVVTEKYVDAGEFVAPGKALAKIARLDTVWVKVYLPAAQFANVKLGTQASVNTESGGKAFTGEVIWTAAESEFVPKNIETKESRSNLVYAVKVRIPNTDGTLKIGQPVFVSIGS